MTAKLSAATHTPGGGAKRIVTGLGVIAPIFLMLMLGGPFIAFMLLVPPAIIALEWGAMASGVKESGEGRNANLPLLGVSTLLSVLPVYLVLADFGAEAIAALVLGIGAIALMARIDGLLSAKAQLSNGPDDSQPTREAIGTPEPNIIADNSRAAWVGWWVWPIGVMYTAVPYMCAAALILHVPLGSYLLMALMASVWCGDISAYYVGKRYGEHQVPLVGWVSPKKSIQGMAGGLVAGTLGFAYFLVMTPLPLWLVVLAPFFSLLAQMGDFLESLIKRLFGRKDSGRLLPGHGGMMDRMDGFTLLMPFALALVSAFPMLLSI